MRSALNDATAAKKLKPDHIKAIIRGELGLRCLMKAIVFCTENNYVQNT